MTKEEEKDLVDKFRREQCIHCHCRIKVGWNGKECYATYHICCKCGDRKQDII